MDKLNRRAFVEKLAVVTAAVAMFPRRLFAAPATEISSGDSKIPVFSTPDLIKSKDGIIDLHCHPSMKMYLEGKKLWKRHWLRSPGANLFHMQEDVHGLASGNIAGMLASHYLVEGAIKTQWTKMHWLLPVLKFVWFSEEDKVEHEDHSNMAQISLMIDDLELQVHAANEKLLDRKKKMQILVAQNWEEFKKALDSEHVIPMAHAIEGAHALGRNFPISQDKIAALQSQKTRPDGKNHDMNGDYYVHNLKLLKARGVCLMTLSHFFPNEVAYPVEGISPDEKRLPGMTSSYDPSKNYPLSAIGIQVVNAMFDIGMVVDLTHTTPQIRRDVFKINQDRAVAGKVLRPIVFTHVGSQKVFELHDKDKFPNFKYYDVDQDDINDIVKCKGMIGVIPENFWLAGGDTHLSSQGLDRKDFKYGIPYMLETMIDINNRVNNNGIPGNFDHIGIGTDFDGLADNPKDLYLNTQLSDLMAAMRKRPEIFTDAHIAKITSGNARRVLELGWTNERLEL